MSYRYKKLFVKAWLEFPLDAETEAVLREKMAKLMAQKIANQIEIFEDDNGFAVGVLRVKVRVPE